MKFGIKHNGKAFITCKVTTPGDIKFKADSIANKIPGAKYFAWIFNIKLGSNGYIRILGFKIFW